MAAVDTVKGRYSSYRLLGEVGRGGSARVYRAQDVATRKDVAVKQLLGNRPQDMEDWLREVDALHTLNQHRCPHVVEYLDHMQQHDRLFLVEEFTEHGSLLRCLRQGGPMAESRVCHYVYQTLTALHRMAPWGVVHGDLKASNLLLFEGELVKLTDFALRPRSNEDWPAPSSASSSTHAGRTGRVEKGADATATAGCAGSGGEEFRGSAYWAAPEVLGGLSKATAASDVWSVGCLAVELLTGAPPYFDRTVPNAIHHILKGFYEVVGEGGEALGAAPTPSRGSPGSAAPSGAGSVDDDGGRSSTAAVVRKRRSGAKSATPPTTQAASKHATTAAATGPAAAAPSPAGAANPLCEATLLPPLPPELHLSSEGLAFLRLCFRPRAVDRPSAGELLQHPWFLNCAVPQLLRAVREGRLVGGAGGGGGVIGGDDGALLGAGGSGERFAVIAQWVQRNLLADPEEGRCEAWLRSDALPLLVPVLTPRVMTPKYIGNIMWHFSHFADSRGGDLAPLFLNQLGLTELWAVDELTSACDADHLVTLYCRCCAAQDPSVPAYTPTDPRALRFVLGLEKEKLAACVRALHARLVAEPPAATDAAGQAAGTSAAGASSMPSSCGPGTPSSAAPAPVTVEAATMLGQGHEQQRRARERLLGDGGAAVLCHGIEAQCRTAFLGHTAPAWELATLDLLLAVLLTLEPLPGGRAFLWDLGAASRASPVPALAGSRALLNGATAVAPSPPPPTRTSSDVTSTRDTPSPGPGGVAVSPSPASVSPRDSVPAAAAIGLSASAGGALVPLSSTASTLANGLYPTIAATAASGTTLEPVYWAPTVTWVLAVQEAARSGCEAGVRLLAHFIAVACETRAESLEQAGVSLAATLVYVASCESLTPGVRCAAVEALSTLQATSLRAARYVRDPVRCITLLALTLKRSSGVTDLTASLITALSAMTSEKQMLAACTGCAWMWEAVVALLIDVQAAAARAAMDWRGSVTHSTATTHIGHGDSGADDSGPLSPPPPRRPHRPSTCSSSSSSGGGVGEESALASAAATLVDVVAMLVQWFAEVPLSALVSGGSPSASVSVWTPQDVTTAPPVPVLLRTMQRLLTELAECDWLCDEELQQDMAKVLRHLAPLEPAATAATPSTTTASPTTAAANVAALIVAAPA